MKGKRFYNLFRNEYVKVTQDGGFRVRVLNLSTGNAEWIDRAELSAEWREMPRVERVA